MDRNGKLDGRLVLPDDFIQVNADVVPEPFAKPEIPVHLTPASQLVQSITEDAGDSLCRDSVDRQLMEELISHGKQGKLIASDADLGSVPLQPEAISPQDSDGDGIPDAWEKAHHLDPHNAADGQQIDAKTGYSNLEIYLNELAQVKHGPKTVCFGSLHP